MMPLIGTTNEEKIWNYLKENGLSNCGVAGLMGNLYAESGLCPNNLQNTYEGKLGMADAEYTELVDKGSYTNFVRDSAGYGLAQWTYWSRKEALLAFAKASGKSIGDLEMQLGFLMQELSTSFKSVLSILKTATTVRAASDIVLTGFEKPADQSEEAKQKRAAYGQAYYDKYAAKTTTGGTTMTELELRQKVVSAAQGWLGCKESDGSHKQIIDLYNSHKPLARGYALKYTDAWCAGFASACAIKAGLTDIIPTEVGCEKYIALFKAMGIWQENDAYVPQPADYIFYDWQDGANYAATDNTGAADHVGIVEKVSGQSITVIEGNYSNAVQRRTIAVNGRYIRGYGCPQYSGKATGTGTTATPPPTTVAATTTQKKATDAAQSFDKTLAGTYAVTASAGLHIRNGAATSKTSMAVLPKGTKVQNYGYYTLSGGVKWLYVQVTYNGVTYTGFMSSQYLSK